MDLFASVGIALDEPPAAPAPPPPPPPAPPVPPPAALDAAAPAAALPECTCAQHFDPSELARYASNADLADPAFVAVAGVMRGWTISLPGQGHYPGARFASSAHVRAVLRALRADGLLPPGPEA